jgi:hypothetical protein
MTTRTTRRLLLSVALGAVVAALGAAPAAHADAQNFLDDLYNHGWYSHGGDAGLVANGYQVCRMLNTMNGTTVADLVYQNTGSSVSRTDAAEFVILAVQDLCPYQDRRNQGMTA